MKPKGFKQDWWLQHGWLEDAYFCYDYGGDEDDQLFFYFKCADYNMLNKAFQMLAEGGAMESYRIERKQQKYSILAVSEGWRVWPEHIDHAFVSLDSLMEILIHFFEQQGVTLHLLSVHQLLNLNLKNRKHKKYETHLNRH